VGQEPILLGTVRQINPLQQPDWDVQLLRRPDFSFFHGSAWLKVLAETYGFTPACFVADNSLLPLMEVDSWLTGRRGIALPFTDDCAPLCENAESFKELFQSAIAFGKKRRWKYIECRGGRKFFGEKTPASLAFYGHSLDLAAPENRRLEKLDGSVRRAIRKAENEGVTVEISQGLPAMRDFYSLQCQTRKRHGLPPPPWKFFLNIHKHILSENLGMVAVAGHGGKKIAASVYFFLGGRAIYKYGASDFAQQHLRGSNLVMWAAMQWLARAGAVNLHLGKTALANEGLRRFKLNLGASEEKIEYVKYDLRQENFIVETDGITGWHNRVFRALPVSLARVAGGLLYKHWA
jgi:Acetyltransferase (GNAT) domain